MKFLKKHWNFFIFTIITIFLGCYVCLFAFKKASDFTIYSKPNVELKVYTIWHIETFEGGGKSRLTFLKNLALDIEKQNAGVLFNIMQIEPENLESKLTSSIPDIISFGYGVGEILLPHLTNFNNTYSIRDDLVLSGSFANKVYALPYIVSGYAKFEKDKNFSTTIYGLNDYTHPRSISNLMAETNQYEAYKLFVNSKNLNLIGTARDVFRINNLIDINRISCNITPLDNYTDLIQYIACTKFDKSIDLFVSKLLSNEYQNKLCEYSLFSSLGTKIYSTGIYNDMENAILKAQIPNVF